VYRVRVAGRPLNGFLIFSAVRVAISLCRIGWAMGCRCTPAVARDDAVAISVGTPLPWRGASSRCWRGFTLAGVVLARIAGVASGLAVAASVAGSVERYRLHYQSMSIVIGCRRGVALQTAGF